MRKLLSYQSYHLVGIQGVGMTALALILKELGKTVTGSDLKEEFLTQETLHKKGISFFTAFAEKNIQKQDVIVYSGGHGGIHNPEVKKGISLGRQVVSLAEILGELTKEKSTIAVCGCHGKTTTSSLTSFLGLELGLDVSYYVGAPSFSGKAPGHWGKGQYFVVESDEYVVDPSSNLTPKFLYFSPQYILCTSLDFDHVDVYKDLAEIEKAYLAFFKKVLPGGFLLLNGEDKRLLRLGKRADKKIFSYGFTQNNDFIIKNIKLNETNSSFDLYAGKNKLGRFELKLYGRHNILNSAGVLALYSLLGKDIGQAGKALKKFTGVKRRLEKHFQLGSSYVFDDYAHHPAEISAIIQALKSRFPKHGIIIFFQPHTYSRTKAMKQGFVDSLRKADLVGLLPIFASARESKEKGQISSKDLVQEANNKALKTQFYLLQEDIDWYEFIRAAHKNYKQAVYVTVGAGDIYKKTLLIKTILQKLLS